MGRSLPSALVADGNQFLAKGLEASLDQHPALGMIHSVSSRDAMFSCMEASSGFDIVLVCEAFLADDPHLVIGEVTTQYPETCLIITSENPDRSRIFGCLSAGAHGFFRKTDSRSELHTAVSVVLAGRVFVPSNIPAHPEAGELVFPDGELQLTQRQSQVLKLVADGRSNKEIARTLGIAESTVKVHLGAIFRLFGVHSRTGALAQITSRIGGRLQRAKNQALTLALSMPAGSQWLAEFCTNDLSIIQLSF